MLGEYDAYQYFPFYIFNDFTNLHIRRLDSTVQIYVNNTHNYCWIRTHAHNYAWLTKMDRRNRYRNIRSWLNRWDNDKDIKNIFNLEHHPFIFVSKGRHGCYPSPGYTIRGNDFVVDFPIAFEEREIAKKCLIPSNQDDEFAIEKPKIEELLKSSEINYAD